jgi:hypothetical protein
LQYVRRENFKTWFADVGILYVVVTAFVTAAVLFGSLASFVSSAEQGSSERRSERVQYGLESRVVPSPYP